ncbi:hypothetical protein BCL76_110259 [Streptomyces sp. CG 926]|nr:hypothetical protein BCL76_110259 [Streptomyces sp. CG 926]
MTRRARPVTVDPPRSGTRIERVRVGPGPGQA